MSRGAQIAIGVSTLIAASCSGLFALFCHLAGPDTPYQVPGLFLLSLVCAIVATACFVRRSRPLTLRMIGAVVFIGLGAYVYAEARREMNGQNSFIVEAIAVFVGFGLPAGYVTVFGKYPLWGLIAAAFKPQNADATEN